MKKYIISLALFLALGCQAFSQISYLGEIKVENRKVEKNDRRKVSVSMDFNLQDLEMKKQHVLRLVPVIVSSDGTTEQELPSVIIEGKIRHKANARLSSLEDVIIYPEAGVMLVRKNGIKQTVNYSVEIPFRKWMIGSELQLRANVNGCAQCDEGSEIAYIGNILPPMTPIYSTSFITPVEEILKRRSETRTARLQFKVGSSIILRNYENNAEEIDKVIESFNLVKDNDDLSITGIYVTGYASPESSMKFNLELSKRRAQAFTDYVKRYIKDIDRSLYHVSWKGEDWGELRRQVEKHPDLTKQNEVLDIIDNCGDDKDECENRLKALVPKEIYNRILTEMYPPIRRNEYRIEYNVRHFNVEEGRKMIKTRPDLMSVSEIHKVADSYGKGNPEYIDCLLSGTKAHSSDVTMLNNAALALLEAGRIQETISLLGSAPEDGALLNVLGVAYLTISEYDKARTAFRNAVDRGNKEAEKNVGQMEEYLEYMTE